MASMNILTSVKPLAGRGAAKAVLVGALALVAVLVLLLPGAALAATPPAVTSVTPSSGPTVGGAPVVIKGTGFTGVSGASAILFGVTPAASYTVDSATQITAVTPAHSSGAVHVTVTGTAGTSATTAADYYTFMVRTDYAQTDPHFVRSGTWSDYPKTVAWNGSYGRSSTDGASVTVSFNGTRLDWIAMKGTTTGKADVYLDGVFQTTVDLANATAIYQQDVWSTHDVTSGLHTVQFVRSASSAAGQFLVIDAVDVLGSVVDTPPPPPGLPTITSVTSSSGPTAGGASVVIKGTRFTGLSGASAVLFGSTPAASYTVDSASQITAVTPAHSSGRVDVSVTAAGGTSPASAADSYTFMVRYDQTDGHFVNSGTWSDFDKPAAWNGSYGRSSTAGASVTVTFVGTRLDWIAMKGTSTGKADVYLDGVFQATVNLAATTAVYQQDVWSTHDLASGTHKVKFVLNSTSAAGKFLVIDAVDVLGDITDTVTRYEQDDSRLVYSGTWSQQAVPLASGGTSKHGYEKSAGVIVTFTGTRLDWIATLAPENGLADVSLDGAAPITVDLYSVTTLYQQNVWTTGALTKGTHWVEIRWNTTNNTDKVTHTFISADAFDVVGVLPSASALTTAEIKWAEQRLTDLSYRPGTIDGVKDAKTKSAVIAFQEWEGLSRDGVIGSAVWTRLQTATRPTPTKTSPGSNPWIEVNKTKQVLLYCKNGAVVWTLHVSTGTASVSGGRVSPSGTWTILAKWAMASYRSTYYPMDYDDSQDPILAIHGYPNVPTYPASHGCVRLETWDQDALFPLIAVGTYVYIY
jgi:hypothetical protein